jgi:uncharacterized protein YjiS (DUF1127 family)
MQFTHCCDATLFLFQCSANAYVLGSKVSRLRRPAEGARGTIMFASIVRFIRQWRRYNISIRELSRLGDRELADIGVSRSDIARIAWTSARH